MKAILIVDMPSECIKCPFQAFECCHPLRKEIPMQSITIGEKPDWCPLKELNEETTEELRQTFLDEVIRSMK